MPFSKKYKTNFTYRYNRNLTIFLLLTFLFSITLKADEIQKDSIKSELNKLESKNNFNPRDTIYINLLNKLAVEIRFYSLDSVLLLSNKALKHSKAHNYKEGEIRALIGLGDYYSDNGDYNKGSSYYGEALELALTTAHQNLVLECQNSLASEYEYQGNYEKALQTWLEAIEIARQNEDAKWLSIINENIAMLYATQKDYEQSLAHFKIVKKLNEKIDDELFVAYTQSNMAYLYAQKGDLEYAMFNANACIASFEKHEDMDWLAYGYTTKGKIYLEQRKYKWALFWYKQSENLHQKIIHDERSEIDLLHGLSEANLGLGKDSIAEKYAVRTLDMSERLSINEGIRKASKTLYKINKTREAYLEALAYHELYQELSDTIAKNETKKSLIMLKTKLGHEQQKKALIAENEKALAKQKNYIYVSIFILLVLMTITLLVKRSGNIQKKLNIALNNKTVALEKNQHELREINETKDKLFSIIGHDLRGPIGAFRGVLQLLRNEEIEQKDFLELIPKLGADIDHISFTLNNLLSWGQTQMKGAVTKPSMVCLENIVKENINLLSEIAENKSIKIVSQVAINTMAWSDPDQIDIVIRNLLSNALKFTPKDGLITIKAIEKEAYWEVAIQDTGIGIDKEAQEKIFAKNSNLTTYGTNNEKGTGLGLTLCKEMIENNNGTIWVKSTSRKGTCFYFTLPKINKKYEQAS